MCSWSRSVWIRRKTRRRFCAATLRDCRLSRAAGIFSPGRNLRFTNKLAVSDGSDAQGIPVHSTRMVLVDRHGQIRGYYDATEPEAVTKLLADTNHLLREQPK